ncbi:argininosuccinate lyase [Desulforegula conservatrix]|uniref:argininosuccinate lyase n=1 Tax=Desulforegula conservatrix TaxID=153026 RepID=UPI000411DBDA|nr:argininosuccinate lyase [Desulforegula conservatrix]
MSEKLWSGRFSEKTDRMVERFTSSIQVDKRLYRHDIAGSIAHAKMMAKVGMITPEESEQIAKGLEEIRMDIEAGRMEYSDSLEDIHMHIESRLVEKIGEAGQKLHTGRSRNDQVALDSRMYMRDEVKEIIQLLRALRHVFAELAKKHIDVILPGYTHLQRAQPVLFSHHMMAYYEMFTRDARRFEDCLKRINVMPLGSAALAGTTYPIDREYVARLLDFPEISANSMDAVSDRDHMLELASCASICMMHFSRISEELILWSTSEFSFITLSDAFTTGSSIMPQKKNPDIPELVRGKTGSVYGALFSLLTMMKSLPLAYNRDMQEDKKTLFEMIDTLKDCIDIYVRMLPNMTVKKDVMEASASKGFLNATDLADYLAAKGMPFRKAHHVAGRMVSHALAKGVEIDHLELEVLRQFDEMFEKDVYEYLEVRRMVDRRKSAGGTSTENVNESIKKAFESIESETIA